MKRTKDKEQLPTVSYGGGTCQPGFKSSTWYECSCFLILEFNNVVLSVVDNMAVQNLQKKKGQEQPSYKLEYLCCGDYIYGML